MDRIIMSKKELEQVRVFDSLNRREMSQKAAAELLNITERQVRKKLKKFREDGTGSLAHGNRGKKSKRRWAKNDEEIALNLLKSEWLDFGPTFAVEKLNDSLDIKISRETLRKRMIQASIWSVGKKRKTRRKRRERKRMLGVLVQLDGSPHKWFGPNEQECTLLVFIDDATSRVLWLEFVKSESVEALMIATKNYMKLYGRPISFYVDRGSVFKVNNNNPENEKLTQFERALKQLDVNLIHANSPQTKGRVERSNKTHQDRLIKELKLASIKSMEEANAFLPAYIEKHNNKFAVEAAESGDAHRSLEGFQIDQILCIHEQRVIQNDYTILFKNRILQLVDKRTLRYKPKDKVLIKQMFDGTIHLSIRGYAIEYKELTNRPVKAAPERVYGTPKLQKPSEASPLWNGSSFRSKKPQNQTPLPQGV